MLTGRDAVYSVEQAIGRSRADETTLDASLRSAVDDAARLRAAEAAGFRALAQLRLDAMVGQQVAGDLDATERRALALIEGHRQALESIAARRAAAQTALEQAEAARRQQGDAVAEALKALDERRSATAGRMGSDAGWTAAKAAVEAAERVAAAADDKAKRAEADLAEKGRPYQADPLFMYLWNKKHGQAEDTSGPLVRFFDRKVARLVGYTDARANYAMLQEIPLRLREHAREQAAAIEAARARLAAVERDALRADGAEALEVRVADGRRAAAAVDADVAKAQNALGQIDLERERAVGGGDGAAYGQAIDLLAQSLAREDLRQLFRDAQRTPGPDDDRAVNAIADAREKLGKADAEVADIRGRIRDLAQRRTELEGVRDRARREGFDSPLGGFASAAAGALLGQVIGAILSGSARGSDLDRVFRDNYRWQAPQAPPDFGGSGPWGSAPWSTNSGGDWAGGKGKGGASDWGGGSWIDNGSWTGGGKAAGPWGGGGSSGSGDWGGQSSGSGKSSGGGEWRTTDSF